MLHWPYFGKLSRTVSDVLAWSGSTPAAAQGGRAADEGADERAGELADDVALGVPRDPRAAAEGTAVVLGAVAAAGLALVAYRRWRSGAAERQSQESAAASQENRAIACELDQARLTLSATEELCARVAEVSHGSLWEWDIARNRVAYSPGWKYMIGYTGEELGDESGEWLGRVHADDLAQLVGELAACR